ncbi:EAL domain-containing protein [Frankia sp. CNm7]|uniref:EAL domain-containing protein n=1 Tax=Frankia nepalensis TaxID=1836974 RepID=A0A937RT03_9ACTN|nr:EAL domain-containing protein [Frankia nepalensis]MBL7501021.1 EAL domain-containing protein [Frankia nepalensis]MBL7512496.1 EAL domain-containing protein [Frankia nepalensis]MBL7521476.1 EAL domain-containing protein [Frankia nepalensis]MBL7632799.1 EAL domain-containing protein [Frankia nepalensis]
MTELDLALIHALYAAFDDGTLQFSFEPEVDLRTGSVPGMTARLQWAHPDRGLLEAADIRAVAQYAGLVDQLDQWTLRAAVTECRTWHRMAAGTPIRPPRLWLHIGSRQLARPAFAAEMTGLVHDRGALPPGAVGLAFTEETLGRADPSLPRLLEALRAGGVAVAVRAFGSWIGSPATLDLLPLDLVRMDGRFLRATLRDLEGEAVFAAMVTLARRRRTVVLAEGVDTARFAARVTTLGCDRATGPAFCPPLSLDDARQLALGRGLPTRPHTPHPRPATSTFHMQPTA